MTRLRFSWNDPSALLLAGLLIREAFSFWTGSTYDSEVWLRNAFYVSMGQSPYSFMDPIPGLSFAYTNQTLPSVGYLPLWSLMLAALYRIFTIIPGNNRFVLYFLLKQPPILGDVFLGYVMSKLVLRWGGTAASARAALSFWMFFPYTILISAIWGQFDALVAFVWLASLLTAGPVRRSLLDGVAILLKLFPVIFVPYHFLRDQGYSKLRQLITLGIPAAFTAAVFFVTGWGFENFRGTMAGGAQGVPLGLTFLAVIYSNDSLMVFPAIRASFAIVAWFWVPATIGAGVYAAKHFSRETAAGLVQSLMFVTVVFFLFRAQVYEQYLLYLLPLMLIDILLWHRDRRALFHMTWILGLAFLIFNDDFLIRFLVPVYPSVLDTTLAMDSDPLFGPIRGVILLVIAILFATHLVQLALVLIDEGRDTTPWLIKAFRWARLALRGRPSPGGPVAEDPGR